MSNVLFVGKFPPIQGGVSADSFWLVRALASRGHRVDVVTNANEVEVGFRARSSERRDLRARVGPRVTLHATSPGGSGYLPRSIPFASKLLGRAIVAAQARQPDVVVAYYLEPYGPVAAAVARAVGAPLVLRHAGSDITRLASHPDLREAFRWTLGSAQAVLTPGGPTTRALLLKLGASARSLVQIRGHRLADPFFAAADTSMPALMRISSAWYQSKPSDESTVKRLKSLNSKSWRTTAPVLSCYGKLGDVKGTFDLVRAAAVLAREGAAFSLVFLCAGAPRDYRELVEAVWDCQPLRRRVWIVPPIMPWNVPAFLRESDAVLCLERDFPISIHNPSLPREVLASGSCLIASAEVLSKTAFHRMLRDRVNVFLVRDPGNTQELARVLRLVVSDRELARRVGARGRMVSLANEALLPRLHGMVPAIEALLQ